MRITPAGYVDGSAQGDDQGHHERHDGEHQQRGEAEPHAHTAGSERQEHLEHGVGRERGRDGPRRRHRGHLPLRGELHGGERSGMGVGDFYILCPDNEVTREIDNRRITWAAQDITENRPALSRWHKDYEAKFAEYLKSGLAGS